MSSRLETLLSLPGVATFRTRKPSFVENTVDSTIFTAMHDRLGFPSPRTIHHAPNDDSLLRQYIAYLGGLPIIVKASASTRGEGVVLCNTFESVREAIGLFRSSVRDVILREYVPHRELFRVVVLGDNILCTLRHPIRPNDFRSTIDGTYEIVKQCSAEIEQLAVAALKACEYEFGGVDIIYDFNRGPLLLEVNPPCNFASIRRKVGIDIAGPLVDHLLLKSKLELKHADFA
jgi:glutathione synthase/RimK-type ligase-like ATP-grasp enzyme